MQIIMMQPVGALERISNLIKTTRNRAGLSQFAEQIGMTLPTGSRWERRIARPSPLAIQQVQTFLEQMGEQGANLLADDFPEA